MFDTVITAVIDALCSAELPACERYREELLCRDELICVGLRGGKLLSSGAGEYLGLRSDGGSLCEIYGFRAELCVCMDIFARTAKRCAELLDGIGGALGGISGGLRDTALSCGEAAPDTDTGMYLLPVEMTGIAWFTAAQDEDSGEFLDFTLRGVLK